MKNDNCYYWFFKIENRNICCDDMLFCVRFVWDGFGVILILCIFVVLCFICVYENKIIYDGSVVW